MGLSGNLKNDFIIIRDLIDKQFVHHERISLSKDKITASEWWSYNEITLNVLRRAVSWYGPPSINLFGHEASKKAVTLLLSLDGQHRFKSYYLSLMQQKPNEFYQSDIVRLDKHIKELNT